MLYEVITIEVKIHPPLQDGTIHVADLVPEHCPGLQSRLGRLGDQDILRIPDPDFQTALRDSYNFV